MRSYLGEEHSIGAGRRLSDGSCCDLDASDTMVMQAEDAAEGRPERQRVRPAKERLFGGGAGQSRLP
jgi:hypothetical protein